MILNHEEIIKLGLIEGYNIDEFTNGSYNLTIGKIIDMKKNESSSFLLEPQGMVYVIFKERLIIPSNIIGFAHVKTSLTKKGIMATNIGIVDPNYNGFMSTLLINFSKTDCLINQNESALKVTFSSFNNPDKNIELLNNNKSISDYLIGTEKNILHLDDKFLNLNSIEEKVNKNVASTIFSRIKDFGWFFGGLSLMIALTFQLKTCTDKKTDTYISNYEAQLKTVTETNNLLLQKLEKVEYKLETFKDSLHKVNKNKDTK